ncbi:hypothetical protein Bca52824_023468 [Brassica carinata]|uniref:Retrotransposon gag domain-containing protein n=1 Tax=Brassica carinata TaxID=52824 RepID=A0A8X7VIJ2_BRACI|nr:hypothetical protein Bca52824_023468 [Brassica carinata]
MTLTTRSSAVDESFQRIGALDASVTDLNHRFNELDEKFNRIAATSAVNTESISATVSHSSLEQNRNDAELGYRCNAHRSENKEGRYKKIEMPVFAGEHPFDWIAQAERYFRVTPFTDWSEFKRRLLARFTESFEKTPGKRLFSLQQSGSAAEYVREFQELAHQVKLAEENLIDIFFNGLKQELKEVIKMKEPKTLPDHIEAVMKMEDSEFCKMFALLKEQESKSGKQSSKPPIRYGSQFWKPKQQTLESGQRQEDKQGQTKLTEKQPLKLSDAEYDYKRKNGLCFKCPERWSKTHVCKNKSLQVMVVNQGCEMELVEEEFFEACEGDERTEIMELSLYSFLGWSSPTTTRIKGKIGKTSVVVLIDSEPPTLFHQIL